MREDLSASPMRIEREARVNPPTASFAAPGSKEAPEVLTEVVEVEVHLVTGLGWSR